jgi:hypothetical protein
MVFEAGLQVLPTQKLHLFGDFRYYDYSATFQRIDVQAAQTGQVLASLQLDAFDVRSVRVGSIYEVSRATKLELGWAWTSNGFPARAVTPGTINLGGVDMSIGIRKRFHQCWLNLSVAAVLGFNRTISAAENPLFPGDYGGHGVMFGFGIRHKSARGILVIERARHFGFYP